MHVTIDPRPVQPVNHCFTTCTGRTSRVKPFTGRIRSTVLDKDDIYIVSVVAASYAHLASRGVSTNPDVVVIRKIKKTFIPELEITT